MWFSTNLGRNRPKTPLHFGVRTEVRTTNADSTLAIAAGIAKLNFSRKVLPHLDDMCPRRFLPRLRGFFLRAG
jgi:hypothetical protein